MKVHIVTSANRAFYDRELRRMHRLRHEIFVEELGWEGLRSSDGLDVDEFDDEHAVYLIATDQGEVEGSVRLLPTWKRCMVRERFSAWIGRTFQPAPGAWEWTRWAPGSTRRPRALIRSRSALIVAALEFAASRGIESYLTFCETKFVPQLVELGWEPEPLGLPRAFDQGTAIAVKWNVRPGQLQAARRQLRVHGAASFEAPAYVDGHAGLAPQLLERLLGLRRPDALDDLEALVRRWTETAAPGLDAMAVQGRA
jgi:N-acyl-L-homoserine lactone synthetase